MKAPISQSFGAAKAVTTLTPFCDGHIEVRITELDSCKLATLYWFRVPVMIFNQTDAGIHVTASFAGWPDSGKLRQMMNSMLMRLGIKRRVGMYRGSPYLYRTEGDSVVPLCRVSPCEMFVIHDPGKEDDGL